MYIIQGRKGRVYLVAARVLEDESGHTVGERVPAPRAHIQRLDIVAFGEFDGFIQSVAREVERGGVFPIGVICDILPNAVVKIDALGFGVLPSLFGGVPAHEHIAVAGGLGGFLNLGADLHLVGVAAAAAVAVEGDLDLFRGAVREQRDALELAFVAEIVGYEYRIVGIKGGEIVRLGHFAEVLVLVCQFELSAALLPCAFVHILFAHEDAVVLVVRRIEAVKFVGIVDVDIYPAHAAETDQQSYERDEQKPDGQHHFKAPFLEE